MFDLSFYSLLVAVKSFEPIDKADLSDYYAKDGRLDIDSLFLMFTSGMNNYKEKTLDEVIQYCSSIANDICKCYGIDNTQIPIYQAYLIPYDFSVNNDSDREKLISLYEKAYAIHVCDNEPAWYLKEDIGYRLISMYSVTSPEIDRIKEMLPCVKAGRERYDKWLLKER